MMQASSAMQSIKRMTPWRRPSDLLRRGPSGSFFSSVPDHLPPTMLRRDAEQDENNAELDALNADLRIVVAVFPDVQPEVFRELLLSFSGESRLFLVTEALLMNKPKVVRGRWRTANDVESESPQDENLLPPNERFRRQAYKDAVSATLYDEFRSLSRSAIRAVLAEHNHSYSEARPALLELSNVSWSSTFLNWLSRRKVPSASNHPLISWDNSSGPTLKSLTNSELADELDQSLLAPVRIAKLQEQLVADGKQAEQLNDEEAEAANAMIDCECCFTGSAFERIAVCSDKGHFLCYRCLQHTMSEAIYGQGWAQSVDPERCTVRCIAPGEDCSGVVPQDLVKRAILAEGPGNDTWQRFEDKLIADSLARSGLNVLKCPACSYAEVNPSSLTSSDFLHHLSTHPRYTSAFLLAVFFTTLLAMHLLDSLWRSHENITLVFRTITSLACCVFYFSLGARHERRVNRALPRRLRRGLHRLRQLPATLLALTPPQPPNPSAAPPPTTKGRKFTCRGPIPHTSCLVCKAPWRDPHACFSAHATSLRAHIEAALTSATKRTCPVCGLSFVKDAGCNKLECLCGYKMCYLCRADIGTVGYSHFCPHFRAAGAGPCPAACGRCDLYKDEVVEMEAVKAQAEAEWWAGEGRRRGMEGEREVLERSIIVGTEVKARRWGFF